MRDHTVRRILAAPAYGGMIKPITMDSDEVEDAFSEFSLAVQIMSRLPAIPSTSEGQ